MERLNAPFTVYVTTGMITRTIDAWWFGLAAPPRLFGIEPPRARIEAVRLVDMSSSNAWAEFSNVLCSRPLLSPVVAADGELGTHRELAPLQIEQQCTPILAVNQRRILGGS
jgi:hypothetical protein